MPSNRELQKELIKKNDMILKLSASNSELRTSNFRLSLENEDLKAVNHYKKQRIPAGNLAIKFELPDGSFVDTTVVGLTQSYIELHKENSDLALEVKCLENENASFKKVLDTTDEKAMNQYIAYHLPGNRTRSHTVADLIRELQEVHARCEKIESNWHKDCAINKNLSTENKWLKTKVGDLENIVFDLRKNKVKSKPELGKIKISVKLKDRTVHNMSVSELIDSYVKLNEKILEFNNENLKLLKKASYFEDQFGFLKQQLKKNVAEEVANKTANDLFNTKNPTDEIPLGKRTVSISIDGNKKIFTVDKLATDYMELLTKKHTLQGMFELNDCINIGHEGTFHLIPMKNMVNAYFEHSKLKITLSELQTEIDTFKSAVNDLYNLAAGKKGYL
jgi:hypothetical protein